MCVFEFLEQRLPGIVIVRNNFDSGFPKLALSDFSGALCRNGELDSIRGEFLAARIRASSAAPESAENPARVLATLFATGQKGSIFTYRCPLFLSFWCLFLFTRVWIVFSNHVNVRKFKETIVSDHVHCTIVMDSTTSNELTGNHRLSARTSMRC